MKQIKGFSLVELIVVIAIIGILAAVVLASLNNARVEGIDAKVITEMDTISKRATIEYAQQGTYGVVCGSGASSQAPAIADVIASINTLASSSVVCNSAPGDYAVSVGLNDFHWCIDSTGDNGEIAAALTPGDFTCS